MNVFEQIYWVFTILGTLIGIVVIGYMLYNAYAYRDEGEPKDDADRPELGELPTGGGKGRKLFLSFAISAVVVISLIIWTYGTLLYVENAAAEDGNDVEMEGEDPLRVIVVGHRFNWTFAYEGGNETLSAGEQTWENVTISRGKLVIPTDRTVQLRVTSRDVFHNIGIPELRAKTDAIPGQTTTTWIQATEPGKSYRAKCYEICGAQHSYMDAGVQTMTPAEFRAWYNERSSVNATEAGI